MLSSNDAFGLLIMWNPAAGARRAFIDIYPVVDAKLTLKSDLPCYRQSTGRGRLSDMPTYRTCGI